MRLVPHSKDIYHYIALILVAVITAGSLIGAVGISRWAGEQLKSELGGTSQTIASALDTEEILMLSGTAADEDSTAYASVKQILTDLKRVNDIDRSIYLMGQRDNGDIFFYVDSEDPGSDDYSPAGETYPEATVALKAMFSAGKPMVEGPLEDSFGSFISGLAPIYRPGTNEVIAVVGIDVDADVYKQSMFLAALIPASAGTAAIFLIILFEWARRRNQQLLTVRSELVSVASHELRTPITGIRWAAESLEGLNTDPRAAPLIKAIYHSALNLQASTDDILELTHAMKEQKLIRQQVNLTELVQEVMDTQQLAAQQKNVTIFHDLSWPKSLMVYCDASKMKRAMHNVVSNAIKYTLPDTVVTLSYESTPKMHVIHITDQGIGIPKGEQAKVFAGFYRASNAVAHKIDGTGLGLYLVRVVVKQHGGNVSFASEQDKGTTFTIELPKKAKGNLLS
jgi:signal transduction histidine kinase